MPEIVFNEEDHSYFIDNIQYPSVTTILQDMGLIDTSWFTPESCQRGRYVHQMIEWDQEDELDYGTIDLSILGYLNAWKKFVADTGYVSQWSEFRMASEVYHFAGTADQKGILNKWDAILDVKSGALSPCTALQLAGYEILYGQCKRFALQLHDNGKYSLKEYTDRNDRAVFLAAVALWWWKYNNLRKG